MRQADIFMETEGDAWLERNKERLNQTDPVAEAIEHLSLKPERVLEIGCSNGWRLAELRKKYGCQVFGVEPGRQAGIAAADQHRVPVWQSTASTLPVISGQFDVLIYGFCLYLTDPSDWFNIVREGDSVLENGGCLIIYDFADPLVPFAKKYEHHDGVLSYHMKFSGLWLAHPWYRLVHSADVVATQVTVLRKDTNAFPVLA